MKKIVAILLTATFILQSCVAYHNVPVKLAEAVDKGDAQVVYKNWEVFKFKDIQYTDEVFIGINDHDTLSINDEMVAAVYLKSDDKSTLATIGLAVLVGIGITAVFAFVMMMMLITNTTPSL